MNTFWKLIQTEWKRIFSNRVVVLIFFGAPLLYGLLFIQVYQKGKITDMPVVVIDEDQTPLSSRIIDALDDHESLKVVRVLTDVKPIAKEMPMREFLAVVTIPHGFEAAVLQKRYVELMADINSANLVTANFASRAVQTVMSTLNAGVEMEVLRKTGLPPTMAAERFEPFRVNYNRFYNPSGNYQLLMIPGILGTIMQQVFFLGLALVFARDFEDGYFKTLVGVSRNANYHILLKLIPFLLPAILMWCVVGAMFPLFNIDMPVFSWPMAALAAAFSLACMFFGMLFSLIVPNQLRATELLMVIATPSFLLSGYTWPLEAMPGWIAIGSSELPLTRFLQGFRKLAVYQGGVSDVQESIIHLLVLALVCYILVLIFLHLKIRGEVKKLLPEHQ